MNQLLMGNNAKNRGARAQNDNQQKVKIDPGVLSPKTENPYKA